MDSETRVVVLIDMDCFYCQVEEKLNPDLKGKPIAVVQYNPWKGGGIIAVNYVARGMGVTRHMRGDEAKEKCPEIELPSVPCSRGKADITKYRDAGKDVARVLQKFTSLLERASIDEAYLDITAPVRERLRNLNVNTITTEMMPNTFALGYDNVEEFLSDVRNCASDSIDFDYEHAQRLVVGALIVSEIRTAVYEETGYRCSAGIAHNKILAKLVCGMNKPNKQTILPKHSIDILYRTLPLKKVKHLGGKFGDTVCEILNVTKMAELQMFSEKVLQHKFDEKNGTWLFNIARGVDLEPVQARFNPKSIGCCKQFKGKAALLDLDSVCKWLKDLGDEIEDRLEKDALENNRTPKQMVVSYSSQLYNGKDISSSRSYNFKTEDELCGALFSRKALELLMESSEGFKPKDGECNRRLKIPIKFLGISVGKFEDQADIKKTKKIKDYFGVGSSKTSDNSKDTIKHTSESNSSNKTNCKDYIMQKFLETSEKEISPNNCNLPLIESSLDKQESFFAKMLNKRSENDTRSIDLKSSHKNDIAKPDTPVCAVNGFSEESNDSEISGSTINNEINNSICLFKADPKEVERVDSLRQLLNNSTLASTVTQEISDADKNKAPIEQFQENEDMFFNCSDCGKSIPIVMLETHADYHLAVKLRDEERQQIRKQNQEKKFTINEDKRKRKPEIRRIESVSITNYLVKVDDTAPTQICSECGKKICSQIFSEHLDFHEAQKLNRELNRKPVLPTGNSVKKRKLESPIKNVKISKCKSIDSFFR